MGVHYPKWSVVLEQLLEERRFGAQQSAFVLLLRFLGSDSFMSLNDPICIFFMDFPSSLVFSE